MTKQEKLQKESERLDKELIEVLSAISVVSGRIAKNLDRLSQKPFSSDPRIIKFKKDFLEELKEPPTRKH